MLPDYDCTPTLLVHYVVFTSNPCSIRPLSPCTSMLPVGQTTLERSTPMCTSILLPAVTKDRVWSAAVGLYRPKEHTVSLPRGCSRLPRYCSTILAQTPPQLHHPSALKRFHTKPSSFAYHGREYGQILDFKFIHPQVEAWKTKQQNN
jgi:hypothetical protein